MFSFKVFGQRIKAAAPELAVIGQPLIGLAKRRRIQADDLKAPAAFSGDESCRLKHVEMFGHSRERKCIGLGNFGHCLFPARHITQDGAPRGVRQSVKNRIERCCR